MQSTSFLSAPELSPGAARTAAARLVSWLPAGRTVVIGAATARISRSLAAYGIPVQHDLDPSCGPVRSAVILISHRTDDAPHATAQLSTLLSDLDVPVCLVIAGGQATADSRAFWEGAMIALDWRKHPLNEAVAAYGELDTVLGLQMVAFERVPTEARAAYPLQALVDERDLHMDMTREPGRRSDAHMTRYSHAAQFVRPGDRVIDVACGLGYGSYQIVSNSNASSLLGLDSSEYAVAYANVNFANRSRSPMSFVVGDAQDLRDVPDESADFAVSVETLEHLREPDLLLSELFRVLVPGGRVYASVPNDWSDETGEDPNPFHFHVYDWRRIKAQFRRNGFEIARAWLQDAGGGQKRQLTNRSMLEIDVEQGPTCDGEWLLLLAQKKVGGSVEDLAVIDRLRELLRLGSRESVDALIQEIRVAGTPMQVALALAINAWWLMVSGSEGCIEAWELTQHSARAALTDPSLEGSAAALLALSVDVLCELGNPQVTVGVVGRLQASHPVALQSIWGEMNVNHEFSDRAVVSGVEDGDEALKITGGEWRALTDARNWLETKYYEHLESIGKLESHTKELELARRWLDDQYHSLSAEVARMGGTAVQ